MRTGMPQEMSMANAECRARADPVRDGDVVLLSGTAPIHRWVQRLTHSKWSQVGIVTSRHETSKPLLFYSCSKPWCPDLDHGQLRTGVQIADLGVAVSTFPGSVAVRSLLPALDQALSARLRAFEASALGAPFDYSLLGSRRSLRRAHKQWEGGRFICSSLVAAVYQDLGILPAPPGGPLANNVLPRDFSADGNATLCRGWTFGPIRLLTPPTQHS
jgi:hypothetical protein